MLAEVFGAGRSFNPDSPNGGCQDSVLVTSLCKDCRGGGRELGIVGKQTKPALEQATPAQERKTSAQY